MFDRDGRHLRTYGGRGDGPGEPRGMQGVHVDREGVLRVYDPAMTQLDSIPYEEYTGSLDGDVPGARRVSLGTDTWTWVPVPFYPQAQQVLERDQRIGIPNAVSAPRDKIGSERGTGQG